MLCPFRNDNCVSNCMLYVVINDKPMCAIAAMLMVMGAEGVASVRSAKRE
jgi:hypothetical protein